MLLYRVCNKIEATHQIVGKPWQKPPGEPEIIIRSDAPGLYLTLFPEMWRRVQNYQTSQLNSSVIYDHTLCLDVPDEYLEERRRFQYVGMEYRLDVPSYAIVHGVAGPEWPLPDWVPQPTREREWNPTSYNYRDRAICYWVPRDIDPSTLWYHPSQPEQQMQYQEYGRQLRSQQAFGGLFESVNQIGIASYLSRF